MSTPQTGGLVALVTGANTGIGKDVARQLALTGRYAKVLIGARDRRKGTEARADLERRTGARIFEVCDLNLSDADAVRTAAARLADPIDDLVMNAGGFGGKEPFKMTRDGVTEIVATNLLGHAVLLDELLRRDLLRRSVVLAGSEAARGVPQMRIERPRLADGSVEEFTAVLDGSRLRKDKAGMNAGYAWAKLVAALWLSHMARARPDLRMVTMSPGGTSGTAAADVYPQPARFLVKHVVMPYLMPAFGMAHGLEVGAKRLVDAVQDERFASGVFYASRKMADEVIDQAELFPALRDANVQDHAAEAVRRFVEKGLAGTWRAPAGDLRTGAVA